MTISDCVYEAADLLDRLGPPDWEQRVDLGLLDILSVRDCVAGQVFGEESDTNGFVTLLHKMVDAGYDPHNYPAFLIEDYRDEWVELIKQRFNSGVLSESPS